VDRFEEIMVKDVKKGECFRLENLIKEKLEKLVYEKKIMKDKRDECKDIIVRLDGMTKEEMGEVMKKLSIM
jgi:glycyl-tRNA synthetase